jgi:hypothetical protein
MRSLSPMRLLRTCGRRQKARPIAATRPRCAPPRPARAAQRASRRAPRAAGGKRARYNDDVASSSDDDQERGALRCPRCCAPLPASITLRCLLLPWCTQEWRRPAAPALHARTPAAHPPPPCAGGAHDQEPPLRRLPKLPKQEAPGPAAQATSLRVQGTLHVFFGRSSSAEVRPCLPACMPVSQGLPAPAQAAGWPQWGAAVAAPTAHVLAWAQDVTQPEAAPRPAARRASLPPKATPKTGAGPLCPCSPPAGRAPLRAAPGRLAATCFLPSRGDSRPPGPCCCAGQRSKAAKAGSTERPTQQQLESEDDEDEGDDEGGEAAGQSPASAAVGCPHLRAWGRPGARYVVAGGRVQGRGG